MNKFFLCLLFFVLIGCQSEYEDVSHEDQYSQLVNATFKTVETLSVHGVNMEENIRKEIDIYTVSRKPGGGGRYVIKKFDLKRGSKINVKKVLRCKSCFPSKIKFSIDILSEKLALEKPIYLVNLSVDDGSGKLIMNPEVFLEIK